MRLKYITKFFLVAACGLVTFAACSDEYLDKKVDVSETQEKVYSDSAKVAVLSMAFTVKSAIPIVINGSGSVVLIFLQRTGGKRGGTKHGYVLSQGTVNVIMQENRCVEQYV